MSLCNGNIYSELSAEMPEEALETLVQAGSFRIERIVSFGQATPEGVWYDQEEDEWVMLLTGGAALLIDGEAAPRVMEPGDYLFLPAHCRHRIEWTMKGENTVWLAVHGRNEEQFCHRSAADNGFN